MKDEANFFKSKFNFEKSGSIGTEEEVFITDRRGRLAPCSLAILKTIGKEFGINYSNWARESEELGEIQEQCLMVIKNYSGIQPELPKSQLEMVSGVFMDTESLINDMTKRRRYLKKHLKNHDCEMQFNPAPDIERSDLCVFPRERYLEIAKKQGRKIAGGFIAALHIHYGVDNHENALKVLNALSKNLMEEFNFAYTEKRMSKYIQMVGEENILPPEIRDWNHYYKIMKDIGAIEDPTKCWWLIRINPVGTVELRIADVCEDLKTLGSIIEKYSNLATEAVRKKSTVAA